MARIARKTQRSLSRCLLVHTSPPLPPLPPPPPLEMDKTNNFLNKITNQFTYMAKDIANEAKLLGSNVERTRTPTELKEKIQRVERLYNQCERSKNLISIYMKGPIDNIKSLEASINNLSHGFGSRDDILYQIGHCAIRSSDLSSPQFSEDFKSIATCLKNLNQNQNNLYNRLPEFLALLNENDELKANMDKINQELYISMKELDIERSSSRQNIDLIAEKARIYDSKLNLLETLCNARIEAHSQYALHLKAFIFFLKDYHTEALKLIDALDKKEDF